MPGESHWMPQKLVRNPLYLQLTEILKELLGSDEFKEGDKFLTERQISERFDVSRVTANKALSSLVSDGVLAFRKGVGTFVQDTSLDAQFPGVYTSFTNKALAAGKKPSTRLLRFDRVAGSVLPSRIRQRFPVDDAEEVVIVERLRSADQVPMILERHYFRAAFLPGLSPEDLVGSVYDMVKKKYRQTFAKMNETVRSVVINAANAALLEVPPGIGGFLMFFLPINREGMAMYFAEVLYRGDAYEFHNRQGPIWKSHSREEDPGDFLQTFPR